MRTAFVAAGKPVPRRIFLPPRLLRSLLPVVAAAMPGAGRRALAALPIFLDYLGSDQGFANDETCATLRKKRASCCRTLRRIYRRSSTFICANSAMERQR